MCARHSWACKLHAALSVNVLYTKISSDAFNGSEHPMKQTTTYQWCIQVCIRDAIYNAIGLWLETAMAYIFAISSERVLKKIIFFLGIGCQISLKSGRTSKKTRFFWKIMLYSLKPTFEVTS